MLCFSELKALEDLNMSQNKLSVIPDSLLCLTSLQSLIMSNNQISKLEVRIRTQHSVEPKQASIPSLHNILLKSEL